MHGYYVIGIDDVYISNGDDAEDNNKVDGKKEGVSTETTTETIRILIKENCIFT